MGQEVCGGENVQSILERDSRPGAGGGAAEHRLLAGFPSPTAFLWEALSKGLPLWASVSSSRKQGLGPGVLGTPFQL